MARRSRAALLAVALITLGTGVGVLAPSAGAQTKEWALVNDSPAYSFGGGVPVRNGPLAVAALQGTKTGTGLELTVTNITSSVPAGTALSARVGFYGQPSRRPMIVGGFEFAYTGTGTVEGTLVERSEEGTATSAEVWEPADEDFGDVTVEYAGDFSTITISATGAYKKLLRDPLTAVGLDLWGGAPGSSIQPSARVSIGDLIGSRPGVFAQQGTGVGADGTPQPWITRPVAKDFFKVQVFAFTEADDPEHVEIDVGEYTKDATQIRLFVANQFSALPAGSTFPPYDLILFAPDDASGVVRAGDAFVSSEAGTFEVKKRKTTFSLTFAQELHAGFASVQVVVPGFDDLVLLATGFQVKF